MGFYLNSGNEGFRRVLRSKIYVDKTGMIEYVNSVLGTNDAFLCVSRPRRFGKSMAAMFFWSESIMMTKNIPAS